MTPKETLLAYLQAVERRDFEQARRFLADEGFSHRNPLETFDDPDAFIDFISRVGPILKAIELDHLMAEGTEVMALVTYLTTVDDLARVRVATWARVQAGRMVAMETLFDTHPYQRMFQA